MLKLETSLSFSHHFPFISQLDLHIVKLTFPHRLAIEKDPQYVKAMIVLGQTLMQEGLLEEASEYLDCAISKVWFSCIC